MIVVNFAHLLTGDQREALERMSGQVIDRVIDVSSHFDPEVSFVEQARRLVDTVGFSAEEWQTVPMVVNLPTLHVIAALVLAEIHGRSGHFPSVVRMRLAEGAVPACYKVAELMNLQAVRDQARSRRL